MIQFDSYFSNGLNQTTNQKSYQDSCIERPSTAPTSHATKSQPESAGLEGAASRAEGWGKLVTWQRNVDGVDGFDGWENLPGKNVFWWAS